MAREPGRGGSGCSTRGGRGGGGNGGRDGQETAERGVPDGLLLGAISFLLGLTLLVWTATGLAGLFSRGGWPDGVSFVRTPKAMRHLVAEPHNLAAAWPETPAEDLSGYGLFWGIFISELMVLFVLTVFAIGTVARYRIVRAQRRAEASGKRPKNDDGGAVDPRPAAGAPREGTPAGPWESAAPGPRNAGGPTGHLPPPRHPGGGLEHQGHGSTPTADPNAIGADSGARAGQPGGVPVQDVRLGHDGAAGAAGAGPDDPATRPATASTSPGTAAWQGTALPHAVPHGNPPHLAGVTPADGPAEPGPLPADLNGARSNQSGHGLPTPGTETALGAVGGAGAPAGPSVPGPRATVFPAPEPSLPRIVYGAQRGDAAVRTALDADGPLLVVTSDPELWSVTKDSRAKLGPVQVYDPTHRLDTPARVRWNPAAGCETRDTAATRAAALLAPVRPQHALDRPTADAAETLLRCWLHAAAVDGRPFRQVHRWAQGNSAHEPVRILRTHPKAAGGAAGELEATLTAHPERRDMAQELTARALSALSSIHIRDACNPGRADTFAVESFIPEGGTLYVVGESIEDPRSHPGAMPLLTALVSSVVERGRRMAERSSSGRLDPPITLVLEDIAAVAPTPALPDLIAQGAAQGMLTLALMRSQEQARTRWPHRALVR
ncbi:hypothetical protein [Streptomyces sp. NPDC018031]|uniref:hypothetical protein n=1 Tax=Streptomyces sp. NPDC018031 TaxID=3365033 RepID=UPI00378D8B0B